MSDDTYLGDGAYLRREPGCLCLYTSNGISETNRVYLHPETLDNLLRALNQQPIRLNQKMRTALSAVLRFFDATEWNEERRAEWKQLTGKDEATTQSLCDTVRAALEVGP